MNRSTHASGIILKTQNIFEHDKLIEVFTEKNGKTKYLAKYTNRPKSKKAGILEVTNVISFVAYSSKSFKLITECNTIKTFPKIRSSFNKLSSSLHIIDVIQKSTIFEQNNTPPPAPPRPESRGHRTQNCRSPHKSGHSIAMVSR